MDKFVAPIISLLETWAQKVPLEVFAIAGSFLEEILAPIPSPFVMALAGSITAAQNKPLIYIFFITVLGAVGKVFGAWVLYFAADKAEDIIFGKLGKFFGVNHENVEKIGRRFKGNWKDIGTLTFLRSIPVLPSSVVSVTCGFIKLNIRTYIIGTFLGTLIRNLFFLYLGYTGLIASKSVVSGIDTAETAGKVIVVVLMVVGVGIFYIKRNKKTDAGDKLITKYKHVIKDELIEKYGKEKIIEGIKILTYKHVDPLPKQADDNVSTLYIFRHGESVDNYNLTFSGWRDIPITETGKKQAEVLVPKLKDIKFDMLISSTQIRAIETLKIALSENESAKDLDIIEDVRIRERSYGDLQGQSKLEYYLKDAKGLEKMRRDFYTIPPNGESLEIVCKRVAEFCDELIENIKGKNINVAISCHGNSIRGFRRYFEHLDDKTVAEVETPLGQDYASYVIK